MADTYRNFDDLRKHEGRFFQNSYKIVAKDRKSKITCIAIHGGNIEPGTSELAEELARNEFNLYKFEGLKEKNNSVLHITSSNFDEPKADKLVKNAQKVISIHGAKGDEPITYIGGLDEKLNEKVKNELEKAGFKVGIPRAGIDGKTTNNIVNRGLTKAGCQLEITRAQRALFFENKSLKSPRTKRSEILYKYVECLRNALND